MWPALEVKLILLFISLIEVMESERTKISTITCTDKDFQQPEPGGLIQNEPNVGDRVKDRLETVKEAVEEASGFLKNKADEAGARPELQKNPAVGR